MAKINNIDKYPIKNTPSGDDFIIGSDSENNDRTVSFSIDSINSLVSSRDNTATHYKGNYDAINNLPIITDGLGTIGDEYRIINAGAGGTTINLGSGNILVKNNDIILHDGTIFFKKVDNSVDNGSITPTSGVLTPTLIDSGGGATYTIGTAQGKWYKIADQITFSLVVSDIITTGTPSGLLRIGGLPNTVDSFDWGVNVYKVLNLGTNFSSIKGYTISAFNEIELVIQNAIDDTNFTAVPATILGSNFEIRISGTYISTGDV